MSEAKRTDFTTWDKKRMAALLPTDTNINPTKPLENEYDHDGTFYVVRNVENPNRIRVLGTSGEHSEDWDVGTRHTIKHDQTWRNLGDYEVVGYVTAYGRGPNANSFAGTIPNRKLPYWVFK